LSVVIPARDEAGAVATTVEGIHAALRQAAVPHEIVVVDDGSSDRTWDILVDLTRRIHTLRPLRNPGPNGFGRAVIFGLDHMEGDAAVVMMADGSEDPGDAVRYRDELEKGFDCVFGSRFMTGGKVEGYPPLKRILNRMGNGLLRIAFTIPMNDLTNAFKAYRREAIEACHPLEAVHFDLTVELPVKAALRGFSFAVIPIFWRTRRTGRSKFGLLRMVGRNLRVALSLWNDRQGLPVRGKRR
jgi:dolichol-phosphate mannosyltransferase